MQSRLTLKFRARLKEKSSGSLSPRDADTNDRTVLRLTGPFAPLSPLLAEARNAQNFCPALPTESVLFRCLEARAADWLAMRACFN
jgi:hypothetical protein